MIPAVAAHANRCVLLCDVNSQQLNGLERPQIILAKRTTPDAACSFGQGRKQHGAVADGLIARQADLAPYSVRSGRDRYRRTHFPSRRRVRR